MSKLPLIDDLSEILTPPRSGLFSEARGLLELPRLLFRLPGLARQPRGDGRPILVLPGYRAGDGSTAILKTYLRLMGYRARGWRLGRNSGNIIGLLPRILKRLASMARRSDDQVTLIGWSMGGYLARELARERPDLVRRVITLGTPVIGGPKYTAVAHAYRRQGLDIEAIAAEVALRSQILLRTPVTAIYSRSDAIVAWRACIDPHNANVDHVEVRSTHFGFGFSPEVFEIIAQRLALDMKQTTRSLVAQARAQASRRKRLLGRIYKRLSVVLPLGRRRV